METQSQTFVSLFLGTRFALLGRQIMALSIERQLPEELLDRVVSMCSGDTLTKLCLTSKQLNRIATPHLYSHINLGATEWDEGQTHISQLSHLLLTSKKHAALVTSVFVASSWGGEGELDEKEKEVWPLRMQELEACLNSHLSKFVLSDKDKIEVLDKVKTGLNEDAMLALLLLCLPSLRRVDINFGCCDKHEDFVSVFELLADNVQGQAVESRPRIDVMVKGEDDKYPNLPVHLAALLHMPYLRSIYGWKMGNHERDPDPDFGRLKPRSSHVEDIELRMSKIQKDNLSHLLAATIPGKLKTFNYEVGCTWAWCSISHPGIMTSLQDHRETLESLGLSHEDIYPHQAVNDDEELYPCDFRPFTALRRLKIAPCYIWGHSGVTEETELSKPTTKEMLWKTLPPNLEQLWICRAESPVSQWDGIDDGKPHFEYDCLLSALSLVIEHKEEYPKLSNIRIEFSPLAWPTNATFENLAAFCQSAERDGIQCTVILTDIYVPNTIETYPTNERRWGWNEDVVWGECFANQAAEKIWIDARTTSDLAQEIRDAREKTVAAHKKA
ncbi:hypothetical protein IQ06DRAFT_13726 [Phaeosphaeriaceae sp. SRC1lsM3a]|nr:hypothetical protein IQ06DRAFT_13726 [Stagonospora sp. SRC1lsM3a]